MISLRSATLRSASVLVPVVLLTAMAVGTADGAPSSTVKPSGVAERSSSLDCGYDGHVNGYPTYNHCGRGSIVIQVDHLFWQTTYACMPPGVNIVPQGNVSWAIIGAEYDGHSCSNIGPVSVVGP